MDATKWINTTKSIKSDIEKFGFAKTEIEKKGATLFTV